MPATLHTRHPHASGVQVGMPYGAQVLAWARELGCKLLRVHLVAMHSMEVFQPELLREVADFPKHGVRRSGHGHGHGRHRHMACTPLHTHPGSCWLGGMAARRGHQRPAGFNSARAVCMPAHTRHPTQTMLFERVHHRCTGCSRQYWGSVQ